MIGSSEVLRVSENSSVNLNDSDYVPKNTKAINSLSADISNIIIQVPDNSQSEIINKNDM